MNRTSLRIPAGTMAPDKPIRMVHSGSASISFHTWNAWPSWRPWKAVAAILSRSDAAELELLTSNGCVGCARRSSLRARSCIKLLMLATPFTRRMKPRTRLLDRDHFQ